MLQIAAGKKKAANTAWRLRARIARGIAVGNPEETQFAA
jgi:hypothetical protein